MPGIDVAKLEELLARVPSARERLLEMFLDPRLRTVGVGEPFWGVLYFSDRASQDLLEAAWAPAIPAEQLEEYRQQWAAALRYARLRPFD